MNKSITVKEWMTTPVQTINCDMPVPEAYNIMMQRSIRRLPVLKDGKLVGLVTLGDLREARPSQATSLSIYELNYLLSKLTVEHAMTHNPFTVHIDTPIQEAAKLMLERKIGGLPVVDEQGDVVGIVTESDIFRMLIDQWDYFTIQRIDPGLFATLVTEGLNR